MDAATLPEAQVAWNPSLGGWTVTGYDLVRQLLRDTDRFTSEGGPMAENLGTEAMLANDSPVHDAVRAIWAKPFGAGAAVARRRELETLAATLLAPVLADLRSGEIVDIVPVLEAMAGKVVLGMMSLGQVSDSDFRRWYKVILDSSAFSIGPNDQLHRDRAEAKQQVYALLETAVRDRIDRLSESEPAVDLVGLIAQAEGHRGITRAVTLDNLFNVFIGGADTTVRWMGNAIAVLHHHSAALAELRASPNLLPQALEEVMRLETVTRFAIRTVRTDGVELAGHSLPRGDTVYLHVIGRKPRPDGVR